MSKQPTEHVVNGADAEAISAVNTQMSNIRVQLSDMAMEKHNILSRLKQLDKAEQKSCVAFASAQAQLRERVLEAGKRLNLDPIKDGWTFNPDSMKFFKA